MKESYYELEAPSLELSLLEQLELLKKREDSSVQLAVQKANEKYLHWEELKYKDWIPEAVLANKELFWNLVKISRGFLLRATPIKDKDGNQFKVGVDNYNEFLHLIDKEMAGSFMGISDFSESDKKQFITRNIIEESIASAQLEGANTSRQVAKKMLLEDRKPRNNSEQMIVNTHLTMQKIEQEFFKEKLSMGLLFELHKMITDKTIPKDKQGVLRETLDENGKSLVIKPWDDFTITYVAPNKKFVEAELPKLIDFANDLKQDQFIHPLIKAILLHFWVGLLHPFEDGNGRLARILFYWYMFKHEYWAFAYLSLSEKINKSSIQYAKAFIYSEQDDCDLTYFIHYNIEKLRLARKDFQKYIGEKVKENRTVITAIQHSYNLNERQIKLLQYLFQDREKYTNLVTHKNLYSIGKVTAAKDLHELVKQGFLESRRHRRNVNYYPTKKIQELFKFK